MRGTAAKSSRCTAGFTGSRTGSCATWAAWSRGPRRLRPPIARRSARSDDLSHGRPFSLRPLSRDSRREAFLARGMRGMPPDRKPVGAFAHLPHVRPCRLLRQLADAPCYGALPQDRASGGEVVRAWRDLGLVLRGRGRPRSGAGTRHAPPHRATARTLSRLYAAAAVSPPSVERTSRQ